MHIRELSAALDSKLAQLDRQLKQLEQQKQTADPAKSLQLTEDIQALIQIRDKLIKSKDIAWRAHELKNHTEDGQRARQRTIGLLLCGLSLLGAAVLIYFALNQ